MKNNKLKLAVIAGADAALKYKESNKSASPQEVIKTITENVENILKNIDEDI